MIDFNIAFGAAFILLPVVKYYGPSRSDIWRSIKLWAEDNEEAALVRETRRNLRRAKRAPRTVTQLDNGREWEVDVPR